jgi:F0F1-type ATP synthase membrane subunit b/b'
LRGRVLIALLLFFPTALWLWGSEEGVRHSGGSLDMIGKVVNFLILFGGLGFILFKPVRAILAGRQAEARRKLDDAQEKVRQAEERLRQARERLSGLDAELKSLQTAAAEEGRAEQERIREVARREADRIKRLTEQDMEAQVRSGLGELKRYAAGLAAERALDRIKKRLTPEIQAGLIDRAIEELSKNDQTGSDSKVRPRAH